MLCINTTVQQVILWYTAHKTTVEPRGRESLEALCHRTISQNCSRVWSVKKKGKTIPLSAPSHLWPHWPCMEVMSENDAAQPPFFLCPTLCHRTISQNCSRVWSVKKRLKRSHFQQSGTILVSRLELLTYQKVNAATLSSMWHYLSSPWPSGTILVPLISNFQ